MLGRLLHRIDTSGPILFDDFMEMCLYDPDDGFFAAGRVRPGTEADFVTSPEVSPWFGRLIARWIDTNTPRDWPIVEIGAGSGALLRGIAEELPDRKLFFTERSAIARAVARTSVPTANAIDSVGSTGSDHAVVVMNEVLDNVPFALARRDNDEWMEVAVGANDGALGLVEVEPRPAVREWADRYFSPVEDGTTVTVQLQAGALLDDVLASFDGVAVLIIDYGGSSNDLLGLPSDAVVRSYRRHQAGVDYLASPGTTDITSDVNIDALAKLSPPSGAAVNETDQATFLRDAGAESVLRDLQEAEISEAQRGDVMAQLKARSNAVGLRALLDPAGLGSFKVVTIQREPKADAAASES